MIISPACTGTIPGIAYNLYKTISQQKEVKVYVAILNDNGESPFPLESTYVFAGKGSIGKMQFLRRLKRDLDIDIAISTLTACITYSLLSHVNEKNIGIFHAPLEQTKNVSLTNYLLCAFSYRFLFKQLDRLYAVSETTKKDVEKNTGRDVQLVYNIHNFELIDRKAIEPLNDEEKNIFSKPVALYVGHLYDTKGVKRLINSFSKINTDCNLVMVGGDENGQIPQSYVDLTRQLGISDRTYFLGHQSNPYKYMRNCSVFVLPSYSEGLPGVLIEALSLNKKVITTDSSIGDWEIMQCYHEYNKTVKLPFENELGIITSNDDNDGESVKQLANAMDKLLNESYSELPFEKSRFEGESLVKYYLMNDNNEK